MTSNLVRAFHNGMGQAVAERTVLRPIMNGVRPGQTIAFNPRQPKLHKWAAAAFYAGAKVELDVAAPTLPGLPDSRWETWEEVANRVAIGNVKLDPHYDADSLDIASEFAEMRNFIAKGAMLMSGRHLQHGDEDQPTRNQEVFTNCSTAAASFLSFLLLLNGSGVGRDYSDALMLVNWDNAPDLRVVLSSSHPDFDYRLDEDSRDARHKYVGPNVVWHMVEDTREGWARAVEIYEIMAFEKIHKNKTLVLEFSDVRGNGEPIKGMQYRPASGPKPLMAAFQRVATIKGAGMAPWMQAMYVDHYFAECVLVGGARRAARMATKYWKDPGIIDFIQVKRPIEYQGLTMGQVIELRKDRTAKGLPALNSFLWSANNSVLVDEEFWSEIKEGSDHATKVFNILSACSYADGTGEPGIINVDTLTAKNEGLKELLKTEYVGSAKFQVSDDTTVYLSKIGKAAMRMSYVMIVNPCGEVALTVMGGYCVIGDVVPFHCDTLEEAVLAVRCMTRALMRVNLMDSLYNAEVKRTNRIGVSLTGVHEFAWKFFGVSFRDLVNPDFDNTSKNAGFQKAAAFWRFMSIMSNAVVEEAKAYAKELGVAVPHTALTVKPAGTTSKLFGLSEGWHLPSMRQYIRWVQFRHDDPLVNDYKAKGYPVRELVKYQGTVIVGFPTSPTICSIGMPEELIVTAAEATPEEQYKWLQLGERFWINGENEKGETHTFGNQISYTLKYDPTKVSYEEFRSMMLDHQPLIRCCSVMPQEDAAAYEYQPEQGVSKAEFEAVSRAIQEAAAGEETKEDIDFAHIDCASGACPIDFNKEAAAG